MDEMGIHTERALAGIAKYVATDHNVFEHAEDDRLKGKSLTELFQREDFVAYIGETRRTLEEEGLSFRGRANSTLQWTKDRAKGGGGRTHVITAGQGRKKLGFRTVELWADPLKLNTTAIESRLQCRFHRFGLPRRLWRVPGVHSLVDCLEPGSHKVFLSYSFDCVKAIEDGLVTVVH